MFLFRGNSYIRNMTEKQESRRVKGEKQPRLETSVEQAGTKGTSAYTASTSHYLPESILS